MNYLYLAIACVLFSVQFLFTKGFSRRASSAPHVGIWNGCVISLLMLCYLLPMNGFRFEFSRSALLYASILALCAVCMSLINVVAMRLGNMVVVTNYVLIGGMLLPFVYGVAVLNERCSALKLVAIALLIGSMLPTMISRDSLQSDATQPAASRGRRILFHGLGLVQFFANGMTSIVSKAHSISPDAVSSQGFTLLGGCIQATLSLIVLLLFAAASRSSAGKGAIHRIFVDVTKEKPVRALGVLTLAGFSLGYALCNGLANVSSNECARTMDASIQYPAITAVIIVLTAIIGRVCFGERITRSTALSLLLSLSGAVLFMFA